MKKNYAIRPTLGVCYYPEHWDSNKWEKDAQLMVAMQISWVRIGEFSWSRMEPAPGEINWQWLDKAIDILSTAGLHIVLGTPTAAPPRWMIDKYPDMLALTADGKIRGFGSRRHYCFSHLGYREETERICNLLAQRYGKHPAVKAWQTDNEYGCHDTVISYCAAAKMAFQKWLRDRYQNIDKLNEKWGNVFWSMEYSDFDQIELPNLTVTEPNPAHSLDFRRFSSDQVISYNRLQCQTLRKYSALPILHNYMGRITDFDHFKIGEDLDIASWDSYPIGFLEDRNEGDSDFKNSYQRQGDPDFQAMHHDLYRAVGSMRSTYPRWWVMEQQPGPVNWAPYNPIPRKNMVRLWTWEAIAHGAEVVSYFRWRQAPFAQEQMHTGLYRPDGKISQGGIEARQVAQELALLEELEHTDSEVAIVFDYPSCWAWEVQPQGKDFDYFRLILDFYCGLRKLGMSIDFLPSSTSSFGNRKLVLIPGLFSWSTNLRKAIKDFKGQLLIGPRSGSKTAAFSIPALMPPNILDFDCKIEAVESLRPEDRILLKTGGSFYKWREIAETTEEVIAYTEDDYPAIIKKNKIHYLCGWPDEQAMNWILEYMLKSAGMTRIRLEEGHRMRNCGSYTFHCNYGLSSIKWKEHELASADVMMIDNRTGERII